MSTDDIPAPLLEKARQLHEQGGLEKALADAAEARRLLDAGRIKGQKANKLKAEKRVAFIEAVARSKKTEYPNLTSLEATAEVFQAIHNRGSKHGFNLYKLPKASKVCAFIESLDIFSPALPS